MSDYMTLLGAEQVQAAASRMSEAAKDMQRAADSIETTMFRQQQFMDEWLMRFQAVLEGATK